MSLNPNIIKNLSLVHQFSAHSWLPSSTSYVMSSCNYLLTLVLLNKMPRLFLIFSQSDYLIQIGDINSHTEWQTVQIQISWFLQKPTDLDLHCLQRQDIFVYVYVEVLWPSQTNGVMSSVVSLHNHTFTEQALSTLLRLCWADQFT